MASHGSNSDSICSQKMRLAEAWWKEKAKPISGIGVSSRNSESLLVNEGRRVMQSTCH